MMDTRVFHVEPWVGCVLTHFSRESIQEICGQLGDCFQSPTASLLTLVPRGWFGQRPSRSCIVKRQHRHLYVRHQWHIPRRRFDFPRRAPRRPREPPTSINVPLADAAHLLPWRPYPTQTASASAGSAPAIYLCANSMGDVSPALRHHTARPWMFTVATVPLFRHACSTLSHSPPMDVQSRRNNHPQSVADMFRLLHAATQPATEPV